MNRHREAIDVQAIGAALDRLGSSCAWFDMGSRLVGCNDSFRTLYGFPVGALPVSLDHLVRKQGASPPETATAGGEPWASVRRAIKGEEPAPIDVHAAGGRVVRVATVILENYGVLQVSTDVSSVHSAEARLQESEERYDFAMRAISEGVYDWDLNDGAVYYSPRVREALGLSPDQLRNAADWGQRIHPDDLPAFHAAYVAHVKGETPRFVCDYRYRARDDSWRWARQHGLVKRDAAGRAYRMIGSTGDITELKFAELELKRAREALEEQNRSLRAEIEAHRRSQATIEYLVDEIRAEHRFGEIISQSSVMGVLMSQLELVAGTDSTVLVLGETGTGKELIACAVHELSRRRDKPLVKVNCAALPHELVESELFGHEKGAFTGASQLRRGRFELANGGTLLLDEVGELPPEAQAKLLRVLQEQEFERVGGSQSLHTDVRVIAATNRDLRLLVEQGRFRSDLFHRLNVFPLTIPPLRERREDIPLLIRHFLERFSKRLGKHFEGVSAEFLDQAQHYHWPGNIRELENIVERSVILSPGETLRRCETLVGGTMEMPAINAAPEAAHDQRLSDIERAHIKRVLAHTGGTIEGPSGAARILGLKPSTLRGRMHKLGIIRSTP